MMLPSTGARSPMFMLACTAGFALIFIFGFMAWSAPDRMPFPQRGGSTHVEMYVCLEYLALFGGDPKDWPLIVFALLDKCALADSY